MEDVDYDSEAVRKAARKFRSKKRNQATGNLLEQMKQARKTGQPLAEETEQGRDGSIYDDHRNQQETAKSSATKATSGESAEGYSDRKTRETFNQTRRNRGEEKETYELPKRPSERSLVDKRKSFRYQKENSDSFEAKSHKSPGPAKVNPDDARKTKRHLENRRSSYDHASGDILPDEPDLDTWQDHKTLIECNEHMLTYQFKSDVTFLVGESEEAIKAHSYVLMSRSSKMVELLESQPNEFSKDYIFPATNTSTHTFRGLLRYMYTDEVSIKSVKQAIDLMAAADDFGPKSLIKRGFQYLLEEMSSDNVAETLEEAHKRNEADVFDKCMQFIFINAVDVMTARGFGSLCRKCVANVVKSDRLNADEFQVYDGLMAWARHRCARTGKETSDVNIREELGELLFHVRFPLMDVKLFTEHLSMKNVLLSKEKIELYQYFHGDLYSLSNHFNTNPRKEYRDRFQKDKDKHPVDVVIPSTSNTPVSSYNPVSSNNQSKSKRGASYRHRQTPFYDSNQFSSYDQIRRVKRFQGVSGPWLLKGVDAISFSCSKALLLRGVQVFGPYVGSDTYQVSLTVYDDKKTEVRNETSTLHADDMVEKMYDVTLRDPVRVPSKRTFTVAVRMKDGKPTHQGVSGLCFVKADDISFKFENSNRSHNGTDVVMGQIPGLLYS